MILCFTGNSEPGLSERSCSQLVMDGENAITSKHLGQIAADMMYEWEGKIADELGLTMVDVADIKLKYPLNLQLQTYVNINACCIQVFIIMKSSSL